MLMVAKSQLDVHVVVKMMLNKSEPTGAKYKKYYTFNKN